jgi:hypothetical protein
MRHGGGAQVGAAGTALTRHGRTSPIVWVLPHPAGGRPLAVLGDYDGGAARGGCDTIPLRDGGMAEAFRLADDLALDGHGVLLEGLAFRGNTVHLDGRSRNEYPEHASSALGERG